MKIEYHKRFVKKYRKFPFHLQRKIQQVIQRFVQDPFAVSLRNHALQGKMKGRRALSVTGDVRIIFEERQGYLVVLFLDLGGHEMVYR